MLLSLIPLSKNSSHQAHLCGARYLALREHIEHCRKLAKDKSPTSRFRLELPRQGLVPALLGAFTRLTQGAAGGFGPVQLWRDTNVAFVGEEGIDEGGLTCEMHSLFWRRGASSEVARPWRRYAPAALPQG